MAASSRSVAMAVTDAGVGGNDADRARLHEMGYKQELKRGLSVVSNFAFSFSIISVLTGVTSTYNTGLRYGGPASMTLGWLVVAAFNGCVALSMAEICSAYPTSGGLYYWSAKLAGKEWASLASWVTGWFNIVGQWATATSVDFSLAQLIQVIILLSTGGTNGGGYVASKYVVLAIYGFILVLHGLINSLPIHWLSWFGQLGAFWNAAGVFVLVILIPSVAKEQSSAEFIFTHLNTDNGMGIHNKAYILGVGLLMSNYCMIGYDTSAHMTEETKNADRSGPIGIVTSVVLANIFGWIYLVTLTSVVTDIPYLLSADNDARGYAIAQALYTVFNQRYGSGVGGLMCLGVIAVAMFLCGVACITSNSRMGYAFSRDGAMPYSHLWHRVSKHEVPLNVVWLSVLVAFAMALTSLGSQVAFQAMVSIATLGLYISYALPILFRVTTARKSFVRGPFHLGRYSAAVRNGGAAALCSAAHNPVLIGGSVLCCEVAETKLQGIREGSGEDQISPPPSPIATSTAFTVKWILVITNLWIIICKGDTASATQRQILLPGFSASPDNYFDDRGIFLLSNGSVFGFGFVRAPESTANNRTFLLAVVHRASHSVVWAANTDSPLSLSNSNFVFDKDGNAHLRYAAGSALWTANASGKGASMRLLDSGNLVVLGRDSTSTSPPLWSSFSNPTNTLISGQVFVPGMALKNMAYRLEIKSGDMMMYYTGLKTPQLYWSATTDIRTITGRKGDIYSAKLGSASWYFYDRSGSLVSQLFITNDEGDAVANANDTLTAVLGGDGSIAFRILPNGNDLSSDPKGIPLGSCDVPARCSPYSICIDGAGCQCSSALSSFPNCNPGIMSPCSSRDEFQLAQLDDGVGYSGTRFASPVAANTNITGCKDACMNNCSCVAVVFNQGNCFLFDQISSFHMRNGSFFTSFVKVPSNNRGFAQGRRRTGITVASVIGPLAFIGVLIYVGLCVYGRKTQGQAEEYGYLETIAGAPTQFTYRELQDATNNFSDKIGKGGFGSVYFGTLPDASRIAVKKLEGVGQGEKEFRSEVTIIGSIRHRHLVKLRGFCIEGVHRLVVYEYMAKGSLHRWIFGTKEDDAPLLGWDTRFYIAVGTAKGLAYLHQDCESKIIHCDIKPENVLLDGNFTANVSDFGLAKLMSREQSHAFTMLRGTRGYLAPEWITNCAVSDKCDVYSYGMLLLEIISGRRNFAPMEISEKAHFPAFAFKKMEEGDLRSIFDAKLNYDGDDDRMDIAIKVALWCIQEDFHQRPSMSKVVQMLEGACDVPHPPTSSQTVSILHETAYKPSSVLPSAVQLSQAR